jgi:hypothetical protein
MAPLTKQEIERRVFGALAPVIGWDITPGSIQQPPPPQPDILCDVVGQGPVAVELVALDDPKTRLRLTNMFGTRASWDATMKRHSAGDQQALLADLQDAHISVQFAELAGTRVRAAALGALQAFLLARPQFSGEVSAEDIGMPAGFDGARIFRGGTKNTGPYVSSPSGGYLQPPKIDKIVEKLRDKTYEPAAPLELFAYATHDEPDGAIGWLESIQASVTEHLAGSKFRRVHLFHLGFLKHISTMP